MLYLFKKIFAAFSSRERIVFAGAVALFLVTALIALGIKIRDLTIVVPETGGEYSEGFVGQPTTLNPLLASSEIDRSLVRLLFSSLGDLAQKIEPEKEGRIWKVRLKENLYWSDGEKLTSDDVVFSIASAQDPSAQSPLLSSWQGVVAERLSELEVQFVLSSPYPFFRENIKHLYPIPEHLFKNIPPPNWRLSDYNLKPIGSGPYVFDLYEKKQNGFIEVYRLKSEHRYHGKLSLLSRINLVFFTSGEDLIRAFNNGVIDGLAGFEPELISKVQRTYHLVQYEIPSYYAAFFNQGQSIPLKELAVRQALSHSIDRVALINEVFEGRATPSVSPLPPALIFQKDLGTLKTKEDIEASLDGAGWKLNSLGVREKRIGKATSTLNITLTVPKISFLLKTADRLAATWREIGAVVQVNPLSPEEVSERVIRNREYQALLFGNVLNPGFDLYAFWHSSERFYPGLNLAVYQNPLADDLIQKIRKNLDDKGRLEDLQALSATINGDAPAAFLYSPNYLYLTRKDLKGVSAQLISEPADRFKDAVNWYLKMGRVLK